MSLVLLLIGGGRAGAFEIDFVAQTALLGEQGHTTFLFSDVDGSGTDLTITARDLADGYGTSEGTAPNPYLDDLFNGNPGGLGVCGSAGLDCHPSSDDNLGQGEVLILSFSSPVIVSQLLFNNGHHVQSFYGQLGIHVGNGNPTSAETFSDIFPAAGILDPSLLGSRFSFVAEESFLGGTVGNKGQLYLGSITFTVVPEPGTAGLLSIGLGGLALLGRRCRPQPRAPAPRQRAARPGSAAQSTGRRGSNW